jgi:hypothetical protein
MQQVWKADIIRMSSALIREDHRAVWNLVGGGCSALLATLSRIGWSSSSAFQLRTHKGRHLDLRVEPPVLIAQLARDAVSAWLWRGVGGRHAALSLLAAGADTAVLRGLVARPPRPGWGPQQQGALACAASGGLWLQQRLCEAGLSEQATCVACGGAPGTLKHRLYLCPALHAWRSQSVSDDVLARAIAAEEDHPLWCRGILPCAMLPVLPAFAPKRQVVWSRTGDGQAMVEGDVFTDGSVTNPDIASLSAGGWAVAQMVRRAGRLVCHTLFHGDVPFQEVDSTTCEIYALLMAMSHLSGPARIHVDNDETIHGMEMGQSYCLAASNKYAHVWRLVWDKVKDLGYPSWSEAFELVSVKAHCTEADQAAGRISELHRVGNAWADKFAKLEARRAAPPQGVVDEYRGWLGRQKEVCMWIGECTVLVGGLAPRDTTAPPTERPAEREAPRPRGRRAREVAPGHVCHTLVPYRQGVRCQVCRRTAKSSSGVKALRASHCAGVGASRPPRSGWLIDPESPPMVPLRIRIRSKRPQPVAYAPHRHRELEALRSHGHKGWWVGEFIGCCTCGAYADTARGKRAAGLARECPGHPTSFALERQRRWLLQGRSPATGRPVWVNLDPHG